VVKFGKGGKRGQSTIGFVGSLSGGGRRLSFLSFEEGGVVSSARKKGPVEKKGVVKGSNRTLIDIGVSC